MEMLPVLNAIFLVEEIIFHSCSCDQVFSGFYITVCAHILHWILASANYVLVIRVNCSFSRVEESHYSVACTAIRDTL